PMGMYRRSSPTGRAVVPRAPPCRYSEGPAGGAGTPATARFAPRAVDRRRSSYCARPHPDTPQGTVHGLPLLPLGGELRPAFSRDPVVFAPAAALGCGPLCRHMALALETVQHGIQHAVGPLQVSA